MYMGYNGATSACTREVLVQGTYIFKKLVFRRATQIVLWKKMPVREPKDRYACVKKFRVITTGHMCYYLGAHSST